MANGMNGGAGTRKICYGLYALYAGGLLVSLGDLWGIAACTATLTLAIILSYVMRRKARGTLYESHFQWLIRTFWIVGGVYLPIVTVAYSIVFFAMADMTPVYQAMEDGAADSLQLTQLLFESNAKLLYNLNLAFGLPFVLWWLWRCWRGFRLLKRNEPVPDVLRWW